MKKTFFNYEKEKIFYILGGFSPKAIPRKFLEARRSLDVTSLQPNCGLLFIKGIAWPITAQRKN